MATPSLAMIPSAYADSKVYSVLPNNGDGDFTFNRDSSATRVGQNGLIQTVGYFGSELVTNGSFDTDSDWTFSGGGVSISGGKLNFVNTTREAEQSISIVNGKTYRVEYKVSNYSAGTVRVELGTALGTARNTNGIYVEEIISAGSSIVQIDALTTFTGSIDYISIKEVTGDQPRLNYDISNGVVQSCPSLLLEPASTNLVIYSEELSNSNWIKIGSTEIISNNSTSPNGSLNSDKVNASTTYNGILGFQDGFSVLSSSDYSVSFFAKKGNLRYLQLFHGGGQVVGNARTNFDLENGIITVSDSGQDASIENYGNGWFRCIVSLEALSTTLQLYFNAVKDANATRSAASDFNENDNLFIWGIQLEQSNYPTSYIPTAGSSQTRVAETCNLTPPSGIIGQTEGAIFFEINFSNTDGVSGAWSISDNSSANRITMNTTDFSSTQFTLSVAQNYNSSSTKLASGNVTYIGNHKVAINYSGTTLKLFIDGVQADSVTTDGFGNYTKFYLAANQTGVGTDARKFIKTYLYDTALTDAQLITLTTL